MRYCSAKQTEKYAPANPTNREVTTVTPCQCSSITVERLIVSVFKNLVLGYRDDVSHAMMCIFVFALSFVSELIL